MSVVAIIAARMASTRFPGKPLAQIRGMPMIGHVYHRARLASKVDDVWIATCDEEIMNYSASIGAKAVMTSNTHERATDRITEAMGYIESREGGNVDVAMLVQGDEPMLVPDMLDELAAAMQDPDVSIANLMSPIDEAEEFEDPNTVKVVCDLKGRALYFSREAIPSRKKFSGSLPRLKQLGLIAFTREALLRYSALPPTPLEEIESVDMNRILEHGMPVQMVPTSHRTAAVDTPSDFARVERLLANDPLARRYLPSGN